MQTRILITGASGSGTSTLGRALAARLGWAFHDGDDYYWVPTDPPFQRKQDPAVRAERLNMRVDPFESSVTGRSRQATIGVSGLCPPQK